MLKPLSTFEAADYLKLTPKTVRVYIAAGRLKANRVGRKLLIQPQELERFVAADGQ